jgi:hypothetical protein
MANFTIFGGSIRRGTADDDTFSFSFTAIWSGFRELERPGRIESLELHRCLALNGLDSADVSST